MSAASFTIVSFIIAMSILVLALSVEDTSRPTIIGEAWSATPEATR